MNKKNIIILLIVVSLFLVSCSLQPKPPVIEKGTEGLSMKIVAGNNNILFENSAGSINVDVENKGASKVNHGVLVLNLPEQFIEKLMSILRIK